MPLQLVRFNISRFGELTVEQARKEAQKFLGQLASGHHPVKERKREQQSQITLKQALTDYINARKTLKSRTCHDYEA